MLTSRMLGENKRNRLTLMTVIGLVQLEGKSCHLLEKRISQEQGLGGGRLRACVPDVLNLRHLLCIQLEI